MIQRISPPVSVKIILIKNHFLILLMISFLIGTNCRIGPHFYSHLDKFLCKYLCKRICKKIIENMSYILNQIDYTVNNTLKGPAGGRLWA